MKEKNVQMEENCLELYKDAATRRLERQLTVVKNVKAESILFAIINSTQIHYGTRLGISANSLAHRIAKLDTQQK